MFHVKPIQRLFGRRQVLIAGNAKLVNSDPYTGPFVLHSNC